ncbi:target of rapamycin complex 2 subunit MAPKAP1-like [Mercenaria mercenaria]|uniref:target of rapamycin complex 2 subunit MAPKAP1-like n=1 Tax=Mercenaria mercenaria TaxID=6596 RepID=UPI00234EDE6E|nr:target of rapamycin complex 2 subunit MAPKAP1-like [Mercenaria mercenaria]
MGAISWCSSFRTLGESSSGPEALFGESPCRSLSTPSSVTEIMGMLGVEVCYDFLFDNKEFLISHIRNSFITSDDTGMCEMIIDVDDHEQHRNGLASDSGMESSDNELSHSYDILPDMDFDHPHRRRSNTAQRLERMKKEKRNQSKVKNIPWKDANLQYNAEEKGHLFEKKDLSPLKWSDTSLISRLSEQLDSSASMGENPFLEYAKFDGKEIV